MQEERERQSRESRAVHAAALEWRERLTTPHGLAWADPRIRYD